MPLGAINISELNICIHLKSLSYKSIGEVMSTAKLTKLHLRNWILFYVRNKMLFQHKYIQRDYKTEVRLRWIVYYTDWNKDIVLHMVLYTIIFQRKYTELFIFYFKVIWLLILVKLFLLLWTEMLSPML